MNTLHKAVAFTLAGLAPAASFGLARVQQPDFTFDYPSDWSEKIPQSPSVRAKVVAPDGTNCVVTANPVTEDPPADAAEALATVPDDAVLESMRQKYHVELVNAQATALDGLPARRLLLSIVAQGPDGPVEMRQLLVWTYTNGATYQVGCGARSELFASNKAAFDQVLSSFAWATPPEIASLAIAPVSATVAPTSPTGQERVTGCLIAVAAYAILAGVFGYLAKRRNRSVLGWSLIGPLFSVPALVAIFLAKPLCAICRQSTTQSALQPCAACKTARGHS